MWAVIEQNLGSSTLSVSFVLLLSGSDRYANRAPRTVRTVYAEKAEAAASKEALLFNCAQRNVSLTEHPIARIIMMVFRCTPKHDRAYASYHCDVSIHTEPLLTLVNIDTIFWASTLVTAMKHPVFAGYSCGFWALSRVLYTLGYTTGDPSKVR